MGLRDRLRGFLIGQTRSFNALGGGRFRQSVSGSIGRGVERGAWWAPAACWAVDAVLGRGHCARTARDEALELAALIIAGIEHE